MSLLPSSAATLKRNGFSDYEISLINGALIPGTNQPQPLVDLRSGAWLSALRSHKKVMDKFFLKYKDATRQDYENFINNWLISCRHAKDPWIWLDQFYFRRYTAKITKARFMDAARSVEMVEKAVQFD